MKFFDRQEEIARLRAIRQESQEEARFTVLTGRRRVGKTELVKHAYADENFVYLFAGKALERYYLQKFAESGKWTRLGSWWDRKGTNEIDLVAENELTERLEVYEVKIDAQRYRAAQLAQKVEAFRTAIGLKSRRTLTTGVLSLLEM